MGGDLKKWFNPYDKTYKISNYVGVDIAYNSLAHFALERIPSLRHPKDKFTVSKLICADLCQESLISSVLNTHEWSPSGESIWEYKVPFANNEKMELFDIVSAQFSIHYMFRTKQTGRILGI